MTVRDFARHAVERVTSLPEGSVLRFTFHALLGVAALVLVLDLRQLAQGRAGDRMGLPATEPVRMERPEPDDQIRPYLPKTRPMDPDDPRRARPRDEAEAEPIRFRLGTHGAAFADGTITPGSAEALAEFLESSGSAAVTELVLHSPGGSVGDALEMAKLIREKGLNTRILPDGYCASSCPLVFAAGVERVAAATSWIGVHQVFALTTAFGSLSEGMDQAQRVSAEAQLQLVEFGVDPRVWIHAMQTPKDKLYVFTPEELAELKLATEVEGLSDPGPAAPAS